MARAPYLVVPRTSPIRLRTVNRVDGPAGECAQPVVEHAARLRHAGRAAEQPVPVGFAPDFKQLDQQPRIVRVANLDADNHNLVVNIRFRSHGRSLRLPSHRRGTVPAPRHNGSIRRRMSEDGSISSSFHSNDRYSS